MEKKRKKGKIEYQDVHAQRIQRDEQLLTRDLVSADGVGRRTMDHGIVCTEGGGAPAGALLTLFHR